MPTGASRSPVVEASIAKHLISGELLNRAFWVQLRALIPWGQRQLTVT